MATKRLTAKDYKNEYENALVDLKVIRSRIVIRTITLCKQHPLIIINDNERIPITINARQFIELGYHLTDDVVENCLYAITEIEKELASRHPHKQSKIDFKYEK